MDTINNGMCRCCASEGTFKDVSTRYQWMGEEEVYADMLRECFDITLSASDDGLEAGICEVCITQLRNSANFKKQVQRTEEQFKRRLQDQPFKSNIVKVEASPLDDPVHGVSDDDSKFSDEICFAGDFEEVPIKTESSEEVKSRKRSTRAAASRSKQPKVEAETSTRPENMNNLRPTVVTDYFVMELFDEDEFSDTEYQEVTVCSENIDAVEEDLDAEDFDDRSLSPPAYSPLSSPTRRSQQPLFSFSDDGPDGSAILNHLRDRSRSPHRQGNMPAEPFPGNVVSVVYDAGQAEVVAEAFLVPDAHEVYARPESDASDGNVRVRSVRRRVRSVRRRGGRRGRSGRGRPTRVHRGEHWAAGEPLQFVYTTDSDVPPELADMVRDVMRKRQERTQLNRERIARRVREAEGRCEENDRESQEDEEFHDATDGRGNSLLGEQYQRFDWFSMETFQGEEEVFQPQQRTGPVRCVESAYDAFRSYWDDNILEHIVDQTNQYATRISSTVFQSDWYPTNADEILCLFAFWMMIGVIRMPTIKSCFSLNPILKTEVFRRIFSQKRYVSLIRALNFVDADPAFDAFPSNSDPANFDRLHRLRPIIDHLNLKFQENYVLSKDICIDESLTLWKGRLKFRQYIRLKAAKFGIKTFELCESATGYLWSFLVYTGKQSSIDSLNPYELKSTSVVLKLINPLLNKGYRLFMDNWYNSPVLARYLKLNRTDCVGTLRPSRQDVPVLLAQAPLKQGQYMARHSGDVCVLTWKDKNRITMLSTCHGAHTGLSHVFSKPPTFPQHHKPQMVLDYNKSMGGVDLKDQMLEPYLIERKRCAKWYMKLFKRLLNCSILNARILFQSSSSTKQNHLTFRLQLVDAILTNHLSHCPSNRRTSTSHSRPSHIIPHGHWPVHMEQTAYDSVKNRQNRKRCVVCLKYGRKTQKTAYMCDICKVPLCVVNCFKSFHSS